MKKLLALTVVLGTATAVVSACGTDTLTMVENVKVNALTDFSCKTSAYQTKTWTVGEKNEKGEVKDPFWKITTVLSSNVSVNFNWSNDTEEKADFAFQAIVTNKITGAKLGTKTVILDEAAPINTKELTKDGKIDYSKNNNKVEEAFTGKFAESTFFSCGLITSTVPSDAQKPAVLTALDDAKWELVDKDAKDEDVKIKGYKYEIAAVDSMTTTSTEWRKLFTASKAQLAPQK